MSFRQYQRRLALQVFDKMCKHTFYVWSRPKVNYWSVILYDTDNMSFVLVRFNRRTEDFNISSLSYEAALDMRERGFYRKAMYRNLLEGIWPKLKGNPHE